MQTHQKLYAQGIHLYTMSGIVFSFLATLALINQDIRLFLVSLFVAVIVDATDGTLARKFAISEIYPHFNGAKLDDLIDYLTYVFLPCMGLIQFNILHSGWEWMAVVPMLASLYGFCQENAKTEESFVGFPSYWNIVFLYLYVLEISSQLSILTLLVFSLLIFVPVHYVYPTKTRFMKRTTITLSTLYAAAMAVVCLFPHAKGIHLPALISLIYPVYYMLISLIHHFRITHQPA